MTSRKPLTDAQGEVRELSAADFTAMLPFSALPAGLQAKLVSQGPQAVQDHDDDSMVSRGGPGISGAR
jgi:hypothetical protein